MGESLDPEDARILLRRYYDIARETVGEYGGILEKFIGDADKQRRLSAISTLLFARKLTQARTALDRF